MESVFEVMKEQLSKGDTVKISGFGNFVVRNKKARRGRNPQTGAECEIVRQEGADLQMQQCA